MKEIYTFTLLIVLTLNSYSQTIDEKNIVKIKTAIEMDDQASFESTLSKVYKKSPRKINDQNFDQQDLISYCIKLGKPVLVQKVLDNKYVGMEVDLDKIGIVDLVPGEYVKSKSKESLVNYAWDIKKARIEYENYKNLLEDPSLKELDFEALLSAKSENKQSRMISVFLSRNEVKDLESSWMALILNSLESYQGDPLTPLNWMAKPYPSPVRFENQFKPQTNRLSKMLYEKVIKTKIEQLEQVPESFESITKIESLYKKFQEESWYWYGIAKEDHIPGFLNTEPLKTFETYVNQNICNVYKENDLKLKGYINEAKSALTDKNINKYINKLSELNGIINSSSLNHNECDYLLNLKSIVEQERKDNESIINSFWRRKFLKETYKVSEEEIIDFEALKFQTEKNAIFSEQIYYGDFKNSEIYPHVYFHKHLFLRYFEILGIEHPIYLERNVKQFTWSLDLETSNSVSNGELSFTLPAQYAANTNLFKMPVARSIALLGLKSMHGSISSLAYLLHTFPPDSKVGFRIRENIFRNYTRKELLQHTNDFLDILDNIGETRLMDSEIITTSEFMKEKVTKFKKKYQDIYLKESRKFALNGKILRCKYTSTSGHSTTKYYWYQRNPISNDTDFISIGNPLLVELGLPKNSAPQNLKEAIKVFYD